MLIFAVLHSAHFCQQCTGLFCHKTCTSKVVQQIHNKLKAVQQIHMILICQDVVDNKSK